MAGRRRDDPGGRFPVVARRVNFSRRPVRSAAGREAFDAPTRVLLVSHEMNAPSARRPEFPTSVDAPADGPGPSHLARRRAPRAPYGASVRLLGHHGISEGRIENLSTRGALVVTDRPLTAGSVLQLRFDTPDGGVGRCAAIVRWVRVAPSTGRAALGVEFQVPPPELRRAIAAYVASHGDEPDPGGAID